MLIVVNTSMPASRIAATSSHRLARGPEPGTFVWASSSTTTISGALSSTASVSSSSKVRPW